MTTETEQLQQDKELRRQKLRAEREEVVGALRAREGERRKPPKVKLKKEAKVKPKIVKKQKMTDREKWKDLRRFEASFKKVIAEVTSEFPQISQIKSDGLDVNIYIATECEYDSCVQYILFCYIYLPSGYKYVCYGYEEAYVDCQNELFLDFPLDREGLKDGLRIPIRECLNKWNAIVLP